MFLRGFYLYGEFLPHLSLFKNPSRLHCPSRSSRLHCSSSFSNLHVSRKLLHFPHTYYCLAIILYGCILFLLWVLFVVIFFFFFFFLMEGATLIGSSPNFRELWAIPHQSIPLILPSQNRSIIASIVMLPIYPLYKLYIFMKVEL